MMPFASPYLFISCVFNLLSLLYLVTFRVERGFVIFKIPINWSIFTFIYVLLGPGADLKGGVGVN